MDSYLLRCHHELYLRHLSIHHTFPAQNSKNQNANIIHRPRALLPTNKTRKTPNPGKAEKYGHHPRLNFTAVKLRVKNRLKSSIAANHHLSALAHGRNLKSRHHLRICPHRVGGSESSRRSLYDIYPPLVRCSSWWLPCSSTLSASIFFCIANERSKTARSMPIFRCIVSSREWRYESRYNAYITIVQINQVVTKT